jgi:hypothetical protein
LLLALHTSSILQTVVLQTILYKMRSQALDGPKAFMNGWFRIGLLLGVLAIAGALFQSSQNGRYQYSTNENHGVVLDTRTGEFWAEDGTHFEPRTARITSHHPLVDDETASDDRTQKFRDCLRANIQAARSHTARRDCVAEQRLDFQPEFSVPPTASTPSH